MPIRNVYGRKPKASQAYGPSMVFAWPSPRKSPEAVSDRPEDESDVSVANAIAALTLHETKQARLDGDNERRALKEKDGNAVVRVRALSPEHDTADDVDKKLRRSPRLAKRRDSRQSQPASPEKSPTRLRRHIGSLEGTPVLCPANKRTNESSTGIADTTLAAYHSEGVRPLLDLVTDERCRNAPTPFASWSSDLEADFAVSKVAEASFAQVYLLTRKTSTGILNDDQSILKIISLNPATSGTEPSDQRPAKVKETSSDIEKVAAEVKLLDRMTEIPGFTNLREMRVLKGRPTGPFISAWKDWNKQRAKGEKSFFPDPSRKANYCEEQQLWAVIEMDHAGFDLEHKDFKVEDTWTVWDVFWGVAIALAKGEEDVQFEHRDLHLGNICLSQRREGRDRGRCRRHTARKVGVSGLETTIIDYTLSRAAMLREEPEPWWEKVFVDLEKEDIFSGDAKVHYQYELYRYMRSTVLKGEPLADTADSAQQNTPSGTLWEQSHPETNLLWLHFLLHELWPELLKSSDAECTCECDSRPASVDRVILMRSAMEELDRLLDLQQWKDRTVNSARDLVFLALEKDWLDPDDVARGDSTIPDMTSMLSRLVI